MHTLLALFLLSACRNDTGVDGDCNCDTDDTEDTDTDTDDTGDTGDVPSEWDGADLVILEPLPGDLLAWGEASSFTALVEDLDGNPLAFQDIVWTSDLDPSWVRQGAYFEDDTLPLGVHTLTAEALLPNGDRVQAEARNVEVLHPDAGLYAGETRIDLTTELKGTEVSGACFGITFLSVDALGEAATGDTTCSIAVVGLELDIAVAYDLTLDDGIVGGTANVDLTLLSWPFTVEGTVEDGTLTGTFGGDLFGFALVEGALDLIRVNHDPDALAD